MHKPTDAERKTFARAVAAEMNSRANVMGREQVTPRQVRKMRQRGEIASKAAEMPWERPRFKALVG